MAFTNQHLQTLLSFALVLFVLGLWATQASSRPLDGKPELLSMIERHEQWMARHGRVYKDAVEKEKRFRIFMENLKYIEDFNKGANKSYTLGLNAFSDLTIEEFRATHTGYKGQLSAARTSTSTPKTTGLLYENFSDAPASMDWRRNGAVTPIKDQGSCGCCWAFSVVAAMEGLNQIKTGKLISFSEQELLDCDMSNNGCNGGNMDNAFGFIQQNQGLVTEDEYPYQGMQGMCQMNGGPTTRGGSSSIPISGYQDVQPQGDETALMQAVAQQPVSVGIDGGDAPFNSYKGGIFTGECGTDMNHAVTFIGYGTDPETGMDYWLVKNSWGESWGENGYMRIQRGVNLCGIGTQASYPIQ